MTTPADPPPDQPSEGLWLHSRDAFVAQLQRAVTATAQGESHLLLGLDIARADEIRATCGDAFCAALRDVILDHVRPLVHTSIPALDSDSTDITLLLLNTSRSEGVELAHSLHDRIEGKTFHWHQHPFRLGVHVGLLELGPQPADAAAWLARVADVRRSAGELGGSGVHLLAYREHALADMAQELDWHEHITQIIA